MFSASGHMSFNGGRVALPAGVLFVAQTGFLRGFGERPACQGVLCLAPSRLDASRTGDMHGSGTCQHVACPGLTVERGGQSRTPQFKPISISDPSTSVLTLVGENEVHNAEMIFSL